MTCVESENVSMSQGCGSRFAAKNRSIRSESVIRMTPWSFVASGARHVQGISRDRIGLKHGYVNRKSIGCCMVVCSMTPNDQGNLAAATGLEFRKRDSCHSG